MDDVPILEVYSGKRAAHLSAERAACSRSLVRVALAARGHRARLRHTIWKCSRHCAHKICKSRPVSG
jgi:hypothetical protein